MKITTFNNLDEITGNEGKILLYDEAKSKIGASTETVNEIIQDQVGGDISRLEGRVDTVESNVDSLNNAIALKADADKVYTKIEVDEKFADFGGFEIAEGTGEDSHPNVDNPDVKKIYLVKKGTKKDKYEEWIWTKEEGSSENTWVCIGETTVDLNDYAKTTDVDSALALKQDSIARVGGSGPLFGNNMKYRFAPEGGTNLNLQEYNSDTSDWEDIGLIVTKVNKEPNKILKTNNINVLEWITPDYYTKSETSGKQEIQDALALKEDKVFVAEYNVTPYAEIKAAYDAGKQIVCMYYPNKSMFPEYVMILKLNEYIPMVSVFIFAAQITTTEFVYANCNSSNVWNYEQKQFYDSTQFKGENNTITAINTSAVGTTLNAGTDLVINNGVIGVNTNGTAEGTYAFVEGQSTQANGSNSHAEGAGTQANGVCSHAEGASTSAFGMYSHAEGSKTYVLDEASHAEGYMTSAIGPKSHAEGEQTVASITGTHAEGLETSAKGNYSHAEGYATCTKGYYSHAEGDNTIAKDDSMHVGGKYNKTFANAAFVIGNGYYDYDTKIEHRSDAFIVDWVGVASATKLATSGIQDVETAITSINGIPASTTADAGKVLTVDSSGIAEWATGGTESNDVVIIDMTTSTTVPQDAYTIAKTALNNNKIVFLRELIYGYPYYYQFVLCIGQNQMQFTRKKDDFTYNIIIRENDTAVQRIEIPDVSVLQLYNNWDSSKTYNKDDVVIGMKGDIQTYLQAKVYISKTDNNTTNPIEDDTNWEPINYSQPGLISNLIEKIKSLESRIAALEN